MAREIDPQEYVAEQRERLDETPEQYIEALRRQNLLFIKWITELQAYNKGLLDALGQHVDVLESYDNHEFASGAKLNRYASELRKAVDECLR